jgi:hypothetical protein
MSKRSMPGGVTCKAILRTFMLMSAFFISAEPILLGGAITRRWMNGT